MTTKPEVSTMRPQAPTADTVTGLVLAGGRATRMGGLDKGLQTWRGMPLAMHAVLRLGPQVAEVIVNANRNLAAYEALVPTVCPDALPDHPGPLAGFLTGLQHATTPWLVTVPCDSPVFPTDLVARLGEAVAREGTRIAFAATREDGRDQPQPVFCLMHIDLHDDLAQALAGGERKIDRWAARHRPAIVHFDDAAAFANFNTLAELHGAG